MHYVQALKLIKDHTGIELEEVSMEKIRNSSNTYAIDDQKQVIGLSLSNVLHDVSFLAEIKNLEVLDISENLISTLLPLSNLINLQILLLAENEVSDLSPLKGLKNLQELDCKYNQISKLSPLKGLKNLQKLDFSGNEVSNLLSLKELKSLQILKFNENQVSDLLPLKELKNLRELHFWNNQVFDLSPLKEMKNLQELYFGRKYYFYFPESKKTQSNQVSDLSPLQELKNLQVLDFIENQVSDLSPLKDLKNLKELRLEENQVSDLSPLKELKCLQVLDFSKNQVSNLSPLQELKNLRVLSFDLNEVSNLSSLQELNNLRVLNFSGNQVSNLLPLKELNNLQILSFSNNQITEFPAFLAQLEHLKKISFFPNPFKIKGITDVLLENFNQQEEESVIVFCELASLVEKQQKEQENWVSFKVPKDFERVFSQYLLLFKDFVTVIKNRTIDFYLRTEGEETLLISNGNTNINRQEIVAYLEEYIGLLSKDLKNYHFHIENQDIDSTELRKELDLFILRHEAQVGVMRQEMRILEFENKDLRQEIERFEIQVDESQKRLVYLENRLHLALQRPNEDQKTTIYCEGENAKLFLKGEFPLIHFFSEFDKSSVFMRVENNPKVFGIIDRDFLTDSEKQVLENKYPNLLILNYYCFENYLYHPANLKELYPDLDTEAYIEKIRNKKEDTKYDIISHLKNDRASYLFFKRNILHTNEQKHLKPLFEMLDSADFETFYKIFSMKKNKDLCGIKDIGKNEENLAKTRWFRNQFEVLLAKCLHEKKE